MSGKASAHLQCAGGGDSFYVVIQDEEGPHQKDREVPWTRKLDSEVRRRFTEVMRRVIEIARARGAEHLTVDSDLAHELATQNLGFNQETQELVSF